MFLHSGSCSEIPIDQDRQTQPLSENDMLPESYHTALSGISSTTALCHHIQNTDYATAITFSFLSFQITFPHAHYSMIAEEKPIFLHCNTSKCQDISYWQGASHIRN